MNETRLILTTHPHPDLDAALSVLAVVYLAGRRHPDPGVALRFDSHPDPTWHEPTTGRYTVDVGGGDLDHHVRHATGGSTADRSTCAFLKVCAWFESHGSPDQAAAARALARQLGPAVLRQDTTFAGFTRERDPDAQWLGLPRLLDALLATMPDEQALRTLWPLVRALFDRAVAVDQTWQTARSTIAAWLTVWTTPRGIVIGVREDRQIGDSSACWDVAWQQHPEARLMLYETTWRDGAGQVVTISRGLSPRTPDGELRGDARQILAHAQAGATGALATELARWHAEEWFAGLGSQKYPVSTPPPAMWMDTLITLWGSLASR